VALSNPYLDFFWTLPSSFRRDPFTPPAATELFFPEWLTLKACIAHHFSWAVPTDAAIDAIHRHANDVIEIGAGSGYWAWMMSQAGIEVAAFDINPPRFTWSPVDKGDEYVLHRHPRSTLFMCWPPWGSPMAANALERYSGKCFIYVGEWLRGNADARFFGIIEALFEPVEVIPLPQWFARDDRLLVFNRKSHLAAPLR
jgi:hypothetical protein